MCFNSSQRNYACHGAAVFYFKLGEAFAPAAARHAGAAGADYLHPARVLYFRNMRVPVQGNGAVQLLRTEHQAVAVQRNGSGCPFLIPYCIIPCIRGRGKCGLAMTAGQNCGIMGVVTLAKSCPRSGRLLAEAIRVSPAYSSTIANSIR